MKHTYLFTAYNNAENMSDAIRKLKSPDAKFIIHVSDEIDMATNHTLQQLMQQDNVVFLKDRVNVNWGGFSHVEAIIKLMRSAIQDTDGDYIHLLSDSCYPIMTPQQLDEFFENNKGKEFIDYEPLPSKTWAFGGLVRTQHYHLHDVIKVKSSVFNWKLNHYLMLLQMHLRLKRKDRLKWGPDYGGSTWWSMSREAVTYALERMDASNDFVKTYRHTFCAEETIMQTIMVNSRFKDKLANDNARYILWEERNGNLPANLDISDYDNVMQSGKVFARKFVAPYGDELKQTIDKANREY